MGFVFGLDYSDNLLQVDSDVRRFASRAQQIETDVRRLVSRVQQIETDVRRFASRAQQIETGVRRFVSRMQQIETDVRRFVSRRGGLLQVWREELQRRVKDIESAGFLDMTNKYSLLRERLKDI